MSLLKIIEEKLLRTGNDKYISKNINEFIGKNCCQKCFKNSDSPLRNVMSLNSKCDYQFRDLPGSKYILKKFCKDCCHSKASSVKIYIEN